MVSILNNYRRIFTLMIVIGILIINSVAVFAYKNLVFDEAGLLTQDQILSLENEANDLEQLYSMDIVITTTNDTQGKSSREYADDYFDYNGFGVGHDYDGILFLIDMDNREAYISTSGIGIRYLTDERIERILDVVFDSGLADGDFYGACWGFLNETRNFLEKGIPSNQHTVEEEEPNRITIFDVAIGIIGGIATGAFFYGTTKSRYKLRNPGNPFSYRNNSIVNIAASEDKLMDSFVTHRIIPKPKPPSGGSSGGRSTAHRSSSGRSHGGGGRKF
ncbi:TPM domain-containing protein [Tissierella sp. Yu-01]|uniref:TPM domain-containing protein n=1 Tax=Tissierella sp. Yu-01 TaxID=3035694 RepID=UPI00240D05E1|nr:TPM domain-containing protein [Tissierella sp. Yu-01]WFA07977.1 TPM domain-containing protein [Tissierella sp. Yu-01]